jgi:hypothetical protein
MRRSKQAIKDRHEDGVAATLRRVGEEQVRTLAADGYDAERRVRATLGDREGDLLRALPPEDRAKTAYELFCRISEGRIGIEETSFWLSMQVHKARHKLEQAANVAEKIKAERSRGGKASSATHGTRWALWRAAFCKYANVPHPRNASPNVKKRWVDAIRFRSGQKIPKPQLYDEVPADLPPIYGHRGKPPSIDTIRQNLFDTRSK